MSIEKTVRTDSKEPRPNPSYEKQVLIERMQAAFAMINSKLEPHSIEAWFERGATRLEGTVLTLLYNL